MAAATTETITPAQARAVSSHRPQTLLVDELLKSGFLDWSDVRNLDDPETGDERAIYEWHLFPDFGGYEYDALEDAGVPVLRSEYGTWVGFDSFGSPYDLYVRPRLAEALYGVVTDAAGLAEARRR